MKFLSFHHWSANNRANLKGNCAKCFLNFGYQRQTQGDDTISSKRSAQGMTTVVQLFSVRRTWLFLVFFIIFRVNGAVISACYRKKPTIHVAIKRCVLHNDPAYRTAILRELRIMATRHPNLIRLREVVIWHDDLWMTMDLMHCSVFTVLCQCGIPENHAVYITCETLKALIYLHGMGYLHRDVKCENILLGPDGQVKLGMWSLLLLRCWRKEAKPFSLFTY